MKSKLFIICLLLCILCSITSVTAADLNNATDEIQATEDDIKLTITPDDNLAATSTFDDLQSQIDKSASGSVITLNNSYAANKKSGIVINKDLTIDGKGYTIDGSNTQGCSVIYSISGTITLKNLVITNGKNNIERLGGAILLDGSSKCTIINCTFIGNSANNNGGAIYNGVKGNTLTVSNSTFTNNGNNTKGGAIYSKGDLFIENSKFNKNHATAGGAISCELDCDIINSTFDENSATYGGAIYSKGDLYILNCGFTNNFATGYAGAVYTGKDLIVKGSSFNKNSGTSGGAINVDGSYTIVDGCTFNNNAAKSSHGGAIYANKWAHVGNSTFIANTAENRGGAIYADHIDFSDSVSFINNSGKGHGGAVYTCTIYNSINNLYFSGNHADSDFGGALYINNKCNDIYFNNCTFIANYAIKGDGGAIYSDSGSTRIHLVGCTFTNNYATGGTEKRYGGAIRSKDTLYVENSVFTGNWAENYGGAIYADLLASIKSSSFVSNHAKEGGAIYVNNKCSISLTNSYFYANYCNERGGAIYTDSKSASLTLTNNAFVNNNAGGQGLDIFNSGDYGTISSNWWGINNPSFGNRLKEYHTFGSNSDHSDSNLLQLSFAGELTGNVDLGLDLILQFNGDVTPYVFDKIELNSSKPGHFDGKLVEKNKMKFMFVPSEKGSQTITAKIDAQTVSTELIIELSNVYAKNLVKVHGDDQVFYAVFRDANGNYLEKGSPVTFQANGNKYVTQVQDNGVAFLEDVVNYKPGSYSIKSINKLTGEFFISQLTVLSRNLTYGMNDTFILRFDNGGNQSVNNQTVTFVLDGKNYVSNVTDGYAFLLLNVKPGPYNIDVLYKNKTIYSTDIIVENRYAQSLIQLNGSTYGSLLPVYGNETFIDKNNTIYSIIDKDTYRYILRTGESSIVYNVTVSNNEEFTNVLRKISDTKFKADVIIINLKTGNYQIKDGFYKDQEWSYLIHLTHGMLFINGNGSTIDDGYHHNFMTIDSGAKASIENLTFVKFYRCFVNNGDLYVKNSKFEKNDARFWATSTPGSVIYNKKTATFENCIFDNNDNKRGISVMMYQSNLMAGVLYAESKSLTNFVKCNFKTDYDTIHACDGSMVVLYDTSAATYNYLTKRPNNNFEQGSCLDYRPASTFNMNSTVTKSYDDFKAFLSDYSENYYKTAASGFVVNLKKGDYSIKMGDITLYDFRTYYLDDATVKAAKPERGENMWIHHRYLLDVGSRPIVINGNGAKLTLTGTGQGDDNHFAFVPGHGTLTLINVTLSGFNTAIVNYGKLILINCTFTNNVVHYFYQSGEGEQGGAIRNYGSVYAYNTTFEKNRATNGAVYFSKGGSASAQFYNCKFKDNTIISNVAWRTGDSNTLFLDEKSVAKIINCDGVSKSNVKTEHDGLLLFRDTLDPAVYNYVVEDMSSLIKLSKFISKNEKYDIINVTFVKKDYGVFPDSTILFKIDCIELIINGNGALVFVQNQKDNDDTQFLVTTSRSSVYINQLGIQGFNIAIENNGGLNIMNSYFINNKADYMHKKDYGGAIVNQGSLTVYNSSFTGGYAKYSGAIYNKGVAHIIISTFSNNKGYNSNSNVDIYNHQASVDVVAIGNYPSVINHFPMAAWKMDLIEASITVGITAIAGGVSMGVAAAGVASSTLINAIVGATVGAVGGMVNGFIYSVDNQDYSTFSKRLFDGILDGLTAVSFGESIAGMIKNGGKVKSVDDFLNQRGEVVKKGDFYKYGFKKLFANFLKQETKLLKEWISAAATNKLDKLVWYSFFKSFSS